jgi:hypothetical protein
LRKAGIAKTPRVTSCAGAAGLGRPWVIGVSLSPAPSRSISPDKSAFYAQIALCSTFCNCATFNL